MAVTASTILSRVRTQLIDNGATQRWSDAELMQWIADGCRTITAAVPSSSFVTSVVSLVAGTLQLIPSNGHMLLAVTRNFDATGLIPGRAIRLVPRDVLDSTLPDWHSTTASPQVQNYVFDPTMPEQYYVYPPNNGLGKAEITYAVAVADFTDPATVLPLSNVYQTALFDYVMFRAHQKDGDFSAGQEIAQAYLQAFTTFVGTNNTGQLENSPNQKMGGFNPQVRGAAKS